MVPVIHDADGKRLRAIAREINDLADRARTKKLTPDDITGGTFTITNPGPYGTLHHAADHQPAPGRDPLHRRRQASGRSSSTDPTAATRSPSTRRHPRAGVGPPRLRRRLRRGVPRTRCEDDPRDARLGGRARRDRSSRIALAGPGPLRGTRYALQRALHRAVPTDDYLLLLEHPHVYTLGPRADPAHVLVPPGHGRRRARAGRPRRRRHLPRPRPARRLPDPHAARSGGGGMADTVAYVRRGRAAASSTRSPTSASPARPTGPRYPGRVGRATEKISAIGVQLSPGSHDARLRAQRRPRPRDVRPHRPVRHRRQGRHVAGAPRARRRRCARSSTPSSPGRRALGRRAGRERPGRRVARPP